MSAWKVPKLWSSRFYILGGGPSLNNINVERLRGQNVIAVNNAYRLGDWIPVLYFMDCAWWEWHKDELPLHPGLKITTCTHLKRNKYGVKWLERGIRDSYDIRPNFLSRSSNSGHGALCLGVKLGGMEAILLGFDMHAKEGHNWHKDHKRKNIPDTIYETNFHKSFEPLKKDLDKMGVKVWNATPGSALETFPIVDPEDFLP